MSAKLLCTISDENPDLQKQIGCMNGIFQLFNRHHFIGSRRMIGHNHKRLPPGQNGNHVIEPTSSLQKTTEKNMKKAMKEKQRVSTESSRTSFTSSSCSSSFSSTDCNKTSHQLERPSFSQTIFTETPARESPIFQSNGYSQLTRKPLDLRDVVKDSIHREARGLLVVKTATKEESRYRTLKYIDSPRPLQQPQSAKTRVSSLNESYRVLPKHQESAWNYNERNDGCLNVTPKDTPRFSYDGRESREGLKSTIKLKELPRLSLDSREHTIRSCTADMKSNYLQGNIQRENGNNILNQQQEPGSYRRPSSVVAKLMGLEVLPDSISTNHNQTGQIKSFPDVEYDPFSRSSRTTDGNKQNRLSSSPRHSHKEPTSPRPRSADSVKKTIASSVFPMEPPPWRQQDGSKGQSPASKTPTKALNYSLSVYGEIEKRLAQLEFKKSGKDLRALKQILEAMHKNKEKLESRNDHASNFVSQTSNSNGLVQSSNNPISATIKGNNSPKSFKSAIVIMKPAKLIGKASDSASAFSLTDSLSGVRRLQTGDSADKRKDMVGKRTAKDLTPRQNHLRGPSSRPLYPIDKNTAAKTLRSIQTLKETHTTTGENTKSGKSSGQKKLGLEKQSRPTTPSSDFSKTRRQSSRQQIESGSPHRKPRPKSPNLKQTDDQLSDISSELRDLSHQGDASSLRSESNISLASNVDTEVTSTDRSNTINGTFSEHQSQKQKNPDSRFKEDRQMAESPRLALEQPSPISVLDTTFFRDESPSPVKKISNAFQDEEPLNSEEAEWIHEDLNHLSSCRKPSLYSEHDHRKVETIESLVMNITPINSTHEEFNIDETAPIYDSMTPDHKYISEILLASGLLGHLESGMMTIQLRPSGLPINPNLFLALEQSKGSTGALEDKHNGKKIGQTKPIEKVQRKLVFDAVNEILGQKLLLVSSSKQRLSSSMFASKRPRRQQLLRNLCLEIDRLQANNSNCSLDDDDDSQKSILCEDLMHETTGWTNCQGEISGMVLDIERLIFKDLISEVVSGEVSALQGRPGGHRRQLFSK